MTTITNTTAAEYLAVLAPFRAANIRAEWVMVLSQTPPQGRMPDDEYTELAETVHKLQSAYRDHGQRVGTVYVVYSYETPIAWRLHADMYGREAERVVYSDARHSVTTSKHLGMVRRAWSQYEGGYPRKTEDGRTVWACCVSSIGPACQHKTG